MFRWRRSHLHRVHPHVGRGRNLDPKKFNSFQVPLCILHQVRESLERAAGLGMMPTAMLELEYPFAELLLCLGFLFILLVESIVHKMFGGAGHGHSHGGGLEKVVVEEETGPQIKIPR